MADGVPLPLWEVVQTYHVVARHFREMFGSFGLTPTEFGVLACLADGDDFTKAELSRAVFVRPQSMDPLIERLLRRGLVVRDGQPRRGRAAGIRITTEGLDLVSLTRPAVVKLNSPERTGVAADEADRLIACLRAIRGNLSPERRPAP